LSMFRVDVDVSGGSGNGSWDDDALAAVSTAWTFCVLGLYICTHACRVN
jgi:hypothetical protein